jgi:hypothetical protein
LAQTCEGGHAAPQLPQLVESLVVSTQAPAQSVRPAPQCAAHCPRLQTPPEQAWPQAPQLAGSLLRSTHVAPQLEV